MQARNNQTQQPKKLSYNDLTAINKLISISQPFLQARSTYPYLEKATCAGDLYLVAQANHQPLIDHLTAYLAVKDYLNAFFQKESHPLHFFSKKKLAIQKLTAPENISLFNQIFNLIDFKFMQNEFPVSDHIKVITMLFLKTKQLNFFNCSQINPSFIHFFCERFDPALLTAFNIKMKENEEQESVLNNHFTLVFQNTQTLLEFFSCFQLMNGLKNKKEEMLHYLCSFLIERMTEKYGALRLDNMLLEDVKTLHQQALNLLRLTHHYLHKEPENFKIEAIDSLSAEPKQLKKQLIAQLLDVISNNFTEEEFMRYIKTSFEKNLYGLNHLIDLEPEESKPNSPSYGS